MTHRIKHAIFIFLIGLLVIAPVVAASAVDPVRSVDQEDFGQFFEQLLSDGAELLFTNIDDDGAPAVIYGQLGLPNDALDLEAEMYDGCLAMAMIATRGEMLEYVFELLGAGDIFGGESFKGVDDITTAQFGDEGFAIDDIFNLLGTDFGLLFSVYVNLNAAVSMSRMGQVLQSLNTGFELSFTDLFSLRIDESIIPPEAQGEIQLPFDSLDIYIYQISNQFDVTLSAVLGGLNADGLLGAIDSAKFTGTRGAAAGLLVIPDMADIMDLVSGFFNSSASDPYPSQFITAQIPDIQGSLSIAAAAYVDEQVVSLGDDSMSIGELIGATGSITPLSANSYVVAHMPGSANVTDITPNTEDLAYFDTSASLAFWNSSALGSQSDYIIHFESDDFPPEVSIERVFVPTSTGVGGSTTVTVTATNEGDVAISNVNITDTGFMGLYSSVTVTGTTSDVVASLAPGASTSIEYTVTFQNEGGYLFPGAVVSYVYDGTTFDKDTVDHGVDVAPDLGSMVGQALGDAMANFPEVTLALGGLVALTGIYSILGLIRGGKEVAGGYVSV